MYTDDQRVAVYPFSRQADGDEIVIGRPDTAVFVAIPDRAVFLLDSLAAGDTVGKAVARYQQHYEEVPDIQGLLEAMAHYGFLAEHGASITSEISVQPAPTRSIIYHFARFPQRLAQLLFQPFSLFIYGGAVFCALLLMALTPSLVVTQRDLEFPDHRTLTILLLTVGSYIALALHEFGHLIAARALGVNSRFGIGHRLWILVVETDLTGLWSVPRKQRYVPLLAGLIVDATSAALLILLLFAAHDMLLSLPPFLERVLRGMVFMYFMRIVWQCSFFMRTDLYYVLATLFGCKNLMQDTEIYIRNIASRLLPRITRVDQSALPMHEKRAIKYYSAIWVIGRILSVALLVTITVPVSLYYIKAIAATLAQGFARSPAAYMDSLLLSIYILLPIFVGMAMWMNSIIHRLRGSFQ